MNSVDELTRSRLREHREVFERYERDCLAKVQKLEERTQQYKEQQREREERLAQVPAQILLNVGGQVVKAAKSTLLKRESLLSEMLSSGKWQADKEGRLFLDRDADKFDRVLDYLQSDKELRMTEEESEELEFLWLYSEEGRIKMEDTERAQTTERGLDMQYRETEKMMTVVQKMEKETERREQKRRQAEEYIEELRETVVLDVRGKQYMTTKKTLQKAGEGSMLSALASGRWTADAAEGYKIDRNRESFAYVLDYLRTGRRDIGQKAAEELDYFGIEKMSAVQERQAKRAKHCVKMWTTDARCITTFVDHKKCVYSVTQLRNGHIATGSEDETVKIWTLYGTCTATFSGHTAPVWSVTELSNGHIASGSEDKTVKIWAQDGTCTATFSGHTAPIWSVTELSNGHIATGSQDCTAKIWTLDGTCTATLSGHTSNVLSVKQLSNGHIATGSGDKTVKIWTLDGTCIATFSGHADGVASVTELSNGHIATGSGDRTVKIWTQDGTCTATFSGHQNYVTSVTELSNGQIATASEDKTVKIWTQDGTCTATFSGHADCVWSVIELSNGQIATASEDSTVKRWAQ
ncbi:hypothetical protein PROFUN_11656 [Planoprotostelium fungivorum]|uniref:BTB domain-containing protein n=1 Tax=Planoprotostelium fungivorum TaxID=1890364 RepID=A0A2P6N9S1_9EUKA|nr:hypothetical protein PROFUN_11656 [Planoprotostelium fungivorum]